MESNNLPNQTNQSIMIKSISNQDQFIIFHKTAPYILKIIQQQNTIQKQEFFLKIYRLISGYNTSLYKQKYYLQYHSDNINQFLSILKNITVFGGKQFKGFHWLGLDNSDGFTTIYYPKLTDIEHINFNSLQRLIFSNQSLDNIQALAFLDMKNIKQINLTNNTIVSFKPLNKTVFSNLQFLVLMCEYSIEYLQYPLNYLQCLHSPRLQVLRISKNVNNPLYDLRALVRLQINEKRWNYSQKLHVLYKQFFKSWSQTQWMIKVNKHYLFQWYEN